MPHTPGPWAYWPDPDSDSDYHYIGLPDRRDEMRDYTLRYAEQHTATAWGADNARLIAAAPETLAELESAAMALSMAGFALRQMGNEQEAENAQVRAEEARAAIRRARGEE